MTSSHPTSSQAGENTPVLAKMYEVPKIYEVDVNPVASDTKMYNIKSVYES